MELPTNILSSLVNVPQLNRLMKAFLQPVDLAPDERLPWAQSDTDQGPIAFQYWPDSISDSKSSEWSSRQIPGGSHPLYQWASGGERTLSFTAIFTTDTEPDESALAGQGGARTDAYAAMNDPYSIGRSQPLSGLEIGTRDLDLRTAVSWLRWFMYPYYTPDNGGRAYEPAKALLVMPNSGIGYDGSDYVLCVMTQCDVTYEASFPSGFPRVIEVSLGFSEVVQQAGRVQFHSRDRMAYAANVKTYLGVRTDGR